jgi:hypothetical protein
MRCVVGWVLDAMRCDDIWTAFRKENEEQGENENEYENEVKLYLEAICERWNINLLRL